ncbi:MAG: glycosyl transferase, group 1 family protein, partial [Bryobacterales bacterium]|nr:glycosyl transferase, group 1 family protein [Bryobacterales bacterium]
AVIHTFVLREIRGLRSLGMDVRVASVLPPDRPSESLSPEEREEANSTYYIKSKGIRALVLANVRAILSMPKSFFAGLSLAIRSSRWNVLALVRHLYYFSEGLVTGFWMRDLAIENLHTHFASTVALFTQAVFPIRFSATFHGPDEFNDPIGFLLQEKIRAAQMAIAISSYGRSQLMRFSQRRDWHKLAVVRLGVNTSEFSPVSRNDRDSQVFEVICVGRLAPAKAQHVLLEACAGLVARGRPLLLRLVGDGPDRKGLEECAQSLGIAANVVFHGALSHDRVLELYRSADVFALASFAEGIPVVLMEAMALAIPCVATAITGIPELIQNEVQGLLVPPSDAAALGRSIERLMDDRALGRRLAEAGREKILCEYDLARNIEALAQVFATNQGFSFNLK